MARYSVPAFTVKGIDKAVAIVVKKMDQEHLMMEGKMKLAINLIYTTARQRRPKFKSSRGKSVSKRKAVSDPGAFFGVPVRTGALRESIEQSVTSTHSKVIGRVVASAPYARYVEYGTSKMQKRPFMRPALDLNKKAVGDILNGKATH